MQDNNINGYMMPNLVNKKLQKEVLPAREFTLSEMLSKFTPEEALKIAYLPIVLTQAAFRFATAVCKALQEIAGNYKISIHTRIINTAVKVIGIKIDNMNFNCD